jgi:hypothetical protein
MPVELDIEFGRTIAMDTDPCGCPGALKGVDTR